jgi:hypothetical protein
MKLIVEKKYLSGAAEQFIQRRAAYAHIHSHHTGHDSYVRRLTRDHYPRLHMYIKDEGERVIFDLHLDQKQTSYGGSHAHNAEYDGPVVSAEMARIKELLRQDVPMANSNLASVDPNTEKRLGHGDYKRDSYTYKEEKKGFWSRLFG